MCDSQDRCKFQGTQSPSHRGPGTSLQSRFSSSSCPCRLNPLCCHHTKFLSGLRTDPSPSGLQAPYVLLTQHIGFPSLHLWHVLPSRSSLVREWKRWSLKHSVFTTEAIITSCQSWSFCIVQVLKGSTPYPRPQTQEASRTLPSPPSFSSHQTPSVSSSCSCSLQALLAYHPLCNRQLPAPFPLPWMRQRPPHSLPHPHPCSLRPLPLQPAGPQ